jgi:pyrimidine-nucleoside phosphorylase
VTAYRLIQRKRDGVELSAEEIRRLFAGYSAGQVADYQMSAFLMAVYFRGLTGAELTALVEVMLASGTQVDLGGVSGVKVDKHSTGGVGDKVSLVLAPLVASLGVPVPMMSGRGLGHTGGTVDKLESIPGMRVELPLSRFRSQLERIGCALITQTEEIVPLDRRLYALRDVTATVESIPLIASSIMSKKIAEGIDALVLDVKLGNGAFLPDRDRAEQLARTMIEIGQAHGRRVVALLTAMDRPLGVAIGNALEVAEAIAALRGGGPADLREVTLSLAAEMLVLGGCAADGSAARRAAAAALDDGRALEKLREVVLAQEGDAAVLDDPSRLPRAAVQRAVTAERGGVATRFDVRAIGLAAVELGAGRAALDSVIDAGVGFELYVRPGERIEAGDRIATVHAATETAAERATQALRAAVELGEGPAAEPLPLIAGRIAGDA